MSEQPLGGPPSQSEQLTVQSRQHEPTPRTGRSRRQGNVLQVAFLKLSAFAVLYGVQILLFRLIDGVSGIAGFSLPNLYPEELLLFPIPIAAYLALGLTMVKEYERATVLFLGRKRNGLQIRGWPERGILSTVRGPGVFFVFPILEEIEEIGTLQILKKPIKAIKTLTKDMVTVDAEGVFWFARDPGAPEKSALEVENFEESCIEAGNAAYKQLIGTSSLAEVLERTPDILEGVLSELRDLLKMWGGIAIALRLTDVLPDKETRDKLSASARAAVDAEARLKTAKAEKEIATANAEAAEVYEKNPMAWELRELTALLEAARTSRVVIFAPSGLRDPATLAAGLAAAESQDSPQEQTSD